MRHVLISILLFSFLHLYAQNLSGIQQGLDKIEHLVLAGEASRAQNELSLQEQHRDTLADRRFGEVFKRLHSYFATFQKYNQSCRKGTLENWRAFLNSYKENAALYSTERAGEKSAEVFSKFLGAVEANQLEKACLLFNRARLLKNLSLEKKYLAAVIRYQEAGNLFRDHQVNRALAHLDAYQPAKNPTTFLAEIQDSLKILRARVYQVSRSEKKRQSFWASKKVSTYKALAWISYSLVMQGKLTNQPLDYFTEGDAREVVIDQVPSGNRSGFSGGVEYRFNERTSAGINLMTTSFNISTKTDQRLIALDYDIKYTAVQLYSKFLLRTYYGMQPFTSIGLGLAKYKRPANTMTFAVSSGDPDPQFYYFNYDVPESSFSTPHLLFDIGMQYIGSEASRLAVGYRISFFKNLNEHTFINNQNIAISVFAAKIF